MDILVGGLSLWVDVRCKDYSSRLTCMYIYFEFLLWEISVMYWERNPLNVRTLTEKIVNDLKYIGALKMKFVAPMPEQIVTITIQFMYRESGDNIGYSENHPFGWHFPYWNNINIWYTSSKFGDEKI